MSYPVAGLVDTYKHPGYNVDHAIVPHGISVVMNAPAVFRWVEGLSSLPAHRHPHHH
jgi:hydroxyacid-oxoacid transhydrogenase